jgi:Activator of Hsp90 ATPase homolog 1-like protein
MPMSHLPPIRREVRVSATQTVAFDFFTLHVGLWWPRGSKHVEGTLGFVDGQLEEHGAEDVYVWGEIITWDAPRGFRMAWREPQHSEEQRTNVDVAFLWDGRETTVRVVQSGGDRVPDPASAAKRAGSDRGWRAVLDAFEAAVPRT